MEIEETTEKTTEPSFGLTIAKGLIGLTAGLLAHVLADRAFDAVVKHRDQTETTEIDEQ